MKKNKKFKIGYIGLYFPIMAAKEHRVYESGLDTLEKAALEMHFELVAWPDVISEAGEASKAARFFEAQNINLLIVQMSSLIMGDVVVPLTEKIDRIAVWVLDEPTFSEELPLNSLTGYNLFVSTVRRTWGERKRLIWLWGHGSQFSLRLSLSIRALSAFEQFKGSKILSIGGVVPSFTNLEYIPDSFEKSLGIHIENVALNEIFKWAENAPAPEIDRITKSLVGQAATVRVSLDLIETTARICYALRKAKDTYEADAAALRCWPEFQAWKNIAPCAAVAWSNDHCMPVACEGDVPGAAAMLLGSIVSGHSATMNDPVALDQKTGTIQMWHCGPGPASWADCRGQCLDYHHTLNRRLPEGGSPAGVSSDIRFAQGPVTLLRIRPDGKSLFVMDGEIVDGPSVPYPGSGGWIGNLRMGNESISIEDFLQMMISYGLEHHYPIMRGHHYELVREIAGWAGWAVQPKISAEKGIAI